MHNENFKNHFTIIKLFDVPDKGEFRFKHSWYERVTSNLAHRNARNNDEVFDWLEINLRTGETKVALLIR